MSSVNPTGVQSLGNGYFMMDGVKLNLMDMMMAIAVKMKDTNEAALAIKIDEINQKLSLQDTINESMNILNTAIGSNSKKIEGSDAQTLHKNLAIIDEAFGGGYLNSDMEKQYKSDKGYNVSKTSVYSAQLQSLQNASSSLSTHNEMDMMELNKLNSMISSCLQLAKSGLQETEDMMKTAAR